MKDDLASEIRLKVVLLLVIFCIISPEKDVYSKNFPQAFCKMYIANIMKENQVMLTSKWHH